MPYKDPEMARAREVAYRAANLEKIRLRDAAHRAENREKIRLRDAAYRAANREAINERRKVWLTKPENLEKKRAWSRKWARAFPDKNNRWRVANPDKMREVGRKSRGLPKPTRPESHACECCQQPFEGKRICLDHCHISGAFRGWLCNACNLGIGKMGDSIEGLMNAVRYLERAARSAAPGTCGAPGCPGEPCGFCNRS